MGAERGDDEGATTYQISSASDQSTSALSPSLLDHKGRSSVEIHNRPTSARTSSSATGPVAVPWRTPRSTSTRRLSTTLAREVRRNSALAAEIECSSGTTEVANSLYLRAPTLSLSDPARPARASISEGFGFRRSSLSSSILSLGSAIMSNTWGAEGGFESGEGTYIWLALSCAKLISLAKLEGSTASPTTAMSPVSVGALGTSLHTSDVPPMMELSIASSESTASSAAKSLPQSPNPAFSSLTTRQARGRAAPIRKSSGLNASGNASPNSDPSAAPSEAGGDNKKPSLGIIGVCALDSKARSKPSRNILNRLSADQEFEVVIFGDKIILDEEPENWPICDYLISFFSEGFPLDKAIEYVRIRKPFSVNDLPMQMVLWDRRLCLQILNKWEVPTPKRVEVNRDGGPRLPTPELAQHVYERTGVKLEGPDDGTGGGVAPPQSVFMVDQDTISVDGRELKKPFVEKPVSGEDHNIHIYYASDTGGGGRRLFRKINNKSSEADETLSVPRSITDESSSYLYESFLSTDDNEDVKAYTVGPDFCHAETRKSPVVDGIVKRNTHGKEMRYITRLTTQEAKMASRIAEAFGQRICGFDLLRVGTQSYVIDVNGWSFVKDNNDYYDKTATILRQIFVEERQKRESRNPAPEGESVLDTAHAARTSSHQLNSLKSVLKSPSMVRLTGHHHIPHHPFGHRRGSRSSGNASPDLISQTIPMSPAPSIERPTSSGFSAAPQNEMLPPSAFANKAKDMSAIPSTPIEPAEYVPPPATKAQWKLKGMVAVVRHADRTPKQKFKFTFHTKPFVDLLKGHREEVLLVGEAALKSVRDAVNVALQEGIEDQDKLRLLRTSLIKKGSWKGTKVQIKPMFKKIKQDSAKDGHESPTDEKHPQKPKRNNSLSGVTLSRAAAAEDNLEFEKLQLIIKWGGEATHSAQYQAQELGENMRNDLLLMNRDAVDHLTIFSSSEKRVTTSAEFWTAAFLDTKDVPRDFIHIRKDLLDDSNAAKDEMDKVKKKLKGLLRKGNKAPEQFTWPENMPEPFIVARNTVELMKFHRRVMRQNYSKLYGGAAASLSAAMKSGAGGGAASTQEAPLSAEQIQSRWCCGEDPELFKERWEKLFAEFQDPDKIDPGRVSELHDTIKFDALHNRQFLEWIFTPSLEMLEEFDADQESQHEAHPDAGSSYIRPTSRSGSVSSKAGPVDLKQDKLTEKQSLGQKFRNRKRSVIERASLEKTAADPSTESYFKLFTGNARSKAKTDVRLEKLRELFLYTKILFDFIGPQEYGILDSEKLEIGLLTSLPLLRAIVSDLEDMQASEGAKTVVYFTKESHIYTLLNCIIEGGIETKIQRNKIPELDYLSTICFELYESQNNVHDDADEAFNYSIRITISPGCHTFEPLDV